VEDHEEKIVHGGEGYTFPILSEAGHDKLRCLHEATIPYGILALRADIPPNMSTIDVSGGQFGRVILMPVSDHMKLLWNRQCVLTRVFDRGTPTNVIDWITRVSSVDEEQTWSPLRPS
jgi:hypothetical protein